MMKYATCTCSFNLSSYFLESRQMMKDVPMLSTGPQTASIEGFNSVLNHFAPKMYGFSYCGILHRSAVPQVVTRHMNFTSETDLW
ncbi:hypothetical protein BaRGS_00035154 [Batillaria attramentaria]|uniref:Uncharacterized protein n=1 Tax=Batillaria attramentaria TaxID=370345 RepID=A0ABD0JFG7_9CAEN